MRFLWFCWPHAWKHCRRRLGYADDNGKILGTARSVCERCGKTKFHWDDHLPSPTLSAILESRERSWFWIEIGKQISRRK